jgi:hypothetical protein
MKHHHKLGKCDNQHTVWLIVWKFWRDGILAPCQEHANQEARQALSSSNERASEYWVRSVYAVRPPRDHQVHTNQRRSATGLHARRGRESEIEGNIRRAPCTPPFTGELKLPAGHRVAVDHIHRFVYPAGLSLSLSLSLACCESATHVHVRGEAISNGKWWGPTYTHYSKFFSLPAANMVDGQPPRRRNPGRRKCYPARIQCMNEIAQQ